MDRETLEKHYMQGYASFFNEQTFMSRAFASHDLSLRIDGVFTKGTRRTLGIPDDPYY